MVTYTALLLALRTADSILSDTSLPFGNVAAESIVQTSSGAVK